MKKPSKFTLNKIKDFLTENTSIIVILLTLFSLISLMMINGFKIDYESLDTDPPSSVLVEDRVPALARYYQRNRVNTTIVLASPSELEEGEVLEDITYEAKYNQHFRFDEAFIESGQSVPTREKHLFTHFSLTPGGEPLDPAERITEEVTVYANWIPKPKINPWQVLAKITTQIELGTQTYIPYKYQYQLVNKGSITNITLDTIPGLIRESYDVKVNVPGTETKEIVEFKYDYNRQVRHTITYDLNGGQLLIPTQRTTYSIPNNGMLLESPGAKMEGHRFLGWSTEPTGAVTLLDDVVMKQDTTVYAIFQKSVAKPDPASGTARYQTSYFLESIELKTEPNKILSPKLLYAVENVANINDEIVSEEITIPHFESVALDKYSYKELVLGAQYLIVPKKDKVFSLNQKVMSFTETNPAGILLLVLIFGVLAWTFLDTRSTHTKYLGWGIILVVAGILAFVLPQLVRFSIYFQKIWDMSKVLNPDGTKITPLIGIKLSGSLLLIAAVFSFATYAICMVAKKKEKKIEKIEE